MPIPTIGYVAHDGTGPLCPEPFEERDLGPNDVHIKIVACGVCHSDVHMVRGEWGWSCYPFVPGHEIVGLIEAVGPEVSKFKIGDRAAVGPFANSCRSCKQCVAKKEQYCPKLVGTSSSSSGGYARDIVCDEKFVLQFPETLDMYEGAPLLCAGITVYSPMKKYGMDKPGKRIGVLGFGGLGHMAVKFGVAFGNHVTVISHTESKRNEAINDFGAQNFINTTNNEELEAAKGTLDYIIDTVSGAKDLDIYMSLLDVNGLLVTVALPPHEVKFNVSPASLVYSGKRIVGSMVGSLEETQEMLIYCGEKGISSTIEKISMDEVNEAWERMSRSDVKYRFVLDVKNSCPKNV